MRSRRKREKDWIRREVFAQLMKHAFYDKLRGEVVSTLSRHELSRLVDACHVFILPDVVRGEVLLDARGKGSLQLHK